MTGRAVLSGVAVAIGAVLAGMAATGLAGFGSIAVLGLVGAMCVAAGAYVARDSLRPLLPVAIVQRDPLTVSDPNTGHPIWSIGATLFVGFAAGIIGWAAGTLGLKGAALVVLLVIGFVAIRLYRHELRMVAFGWLDAGGSWQPGWLTRPQWAAEPVLRGRPRSVRALIMLVAAGAAGTIAWLASSMGLKGPVLLVGLLFVGGVMAFIRERTQLLLFGLACSLILFLHKSFGPQKLVNSGAPAIYVTSLGAVLVLLYACWAADGTLSADVRGALRDRVLCVPLLGGLVVMLSLLVSRNLYLSAAELVRMAWMYLLFLYLAVRIRRRRDIWTVLAGLALFGCVEVIVVVLQWRTGGVLGLSFLGVPTQLGERVIDAGQLGRPFGTIVHPVFLGAVMASLALVALAVGISARNKTIRLICLCLVPAFLSTILLAHSRAAMLAFAPPAAVLIVVGIVRRQITGRHLRIAGAVCCIGAVAFFPKIQEQVSQEFGSQHFGVEVQSRTQLNDLALKMIADHPVLGVGLNNFQARMGPYDRYGLLFAGNPVHNLYLLQAAETGYVGLLAMLVVGGSIGLAAVRLARSNDPLLQGLGGGVAAVAAFFALEELLGFSLRQEIPLALWWILAGLAVAGLRLAPHPPRPAHRASRTPDLRTVASIALGVVVTAAGFAGLQRTVRPAVASADVTAPAKARIVFEATTDRNQADMALYVANGDGSNVHRITPDDGAFYSFPSWAMGGTKLVYAKRDAGSAATNLWMSDADGGHPVQLTFTPWRSDQPKVSPDGRTVIFASFAPGARLVGIYSLDLTTLLVRNLSAVEATSVIADADPRFALGGKAITFSRSRSDAGEAKSQAYIMASDGTGRQQISHDGFFDVDPAISPDGQFATWSSYRGPGTPQSEENPYLAKSDAFFLAVRDLSTGSEETITKGVSCSDRIETESCAPGEGAAYAPLWTPDGSSIGFVSALDRSHTCICIIGRTGGDAQPLVVGDNLFIRWFDWAEPGDPPSTAVSGIGSRRPTNRLLVSGLQTSEADPGALNPLLVSATPDMWNREDLKLPSGLTPKFAKWNADRSAVVFSADVPFDPADRPHPPSPTDGTARHEHFTLDLLQKAFDPPVARPDVAREQIFLMDSGGHVRQLTTPWTEDPHDGVPSDDNRGNTEPDFSPDGHSVVFTNVSSTSPESFIVRLDLQTGEVYNLTNATAGAMPVDDSQPRYSPDGKSIAFTSSYDGRTAVRVMDADTGLHVRTVSHGDNLAAAPSWSPDGGFIAFASYEGTTTGQLRSNAAPDLLAGSTASGWHLVKLDLRTGTQTTLTNATTPALAPVWSPAGDQIAYLSVTGGVQPDVYMIDVDGGDPHIAQLTGYLQEMSLDWK